MKIDPVSLTVLTDWAAQLLGRRIPNNLVYETADDLKAIDRKLSTLKIGLTDAGTGSFVMHSMVNGSEPKNGRQDNYRIEDHHILWVGPGTFVEMGLKSRQQGKANQNMPLFQHIRLTPGGNKWTFDPGITEDLAVGCLGFIDRLDVRRLVTPPEYNMLKRSTESVAAMLDARWRPLQDAALDRFIESLDARAVKVMERLNCFDSALYTYLTDKDEVINTRRRQFALSLPSLLRFAWGDKPAPELTEMVDGGKPLFSPEGVDAIARLLTTASAGGVLRRTAKTYAGLKGEPVLPPDLSIAKALPYLNGVDPQCWPRNKAGIQAFCLIARPLGGLVRRLLIRDIGTDWEGLNEKAVTCVETRLRAATENRVIVQNRTEQAAGKPPTYLLPVPAAPATTKDIEGIQQRIIDYLDMVTRKVIVPAVYARSKVDLSQEKEKGVRAVVDALMLSAPYRQLIEISEKWHEPRRMQKLAGVMTLHDALENYRWLPVFLLHRIAPGTIHQGQDIGNLRLFTYTTPRQLMDEGEHMGHCVAEYVDRCCQPVGKEKHGGNQIVSLRTETGIRLSTLHYCEVSFGGKPRLQANLSYNDSQPSLQAQAAGVWMMEALNDGTISHVTTFKQREERRVGMQELASERMRAVAADPVKLAALFKTARSLFPPAWKGYGNGIQLYDAAIAKAAEAEQQNTVIMKRAETEMNKILRLA